MTERFTERVKMVKRFALEEAQARGDDFVSPEHFLLALLREEKGLAAQMLINRKLTPQLIRQAISCIVGPAKDPPLESKLLPLTPAARMLFTNALLQSYRLGHCTIRTEHLFLALIQEPKGILAKLQRSLNLNFQELRCEIEVKIRGSDYQVEQ